MIMIIVHIHGEVNAIRFCPTKHTLNGFHEFGSEIITHLDCAVGRPQKLGSHLKQTVLPTTH